MAKVGGPSSNQCLPICSHFRWSTKNPVAIVLTRPNPGNPATTVGTLGFFQSSHITFFSTMWF